MEVRVIKGFLCFFPADLQGYKRFHYIYPKSINWPLWFCDGIPPEWASAITNEWDVFLCVAVASVSIRPGVASRRRSVLFQLGEDRCLVWLHLNRAIIPQRIYLLGLSWLAVMLPGTSVTVIPTKSSVWVYMCVCVIVYHRVLSVIIVGIMALIQYPATCTAVWELFSETEITQRKTMKTNKTQRF